MRLATTISILTIAVGTLTPIAISVGASAAPTTVATVATVASSDSVAASDSIVVTLNEYSFTVAGTLKAGGTIRFRNIGKEGHIADVIKLLPGKTVADVKKALDAGKAAALKTVGEEIKLPGAILSPGNSVELTVPTLAAGHYALVCFFASEKDGKPHFKHGMVGEFTVVTAKAKTPVADATYTINPGKSMTGPTALKAGHHTLEVNVGPGGAVLEPVLLAGARGDTVTMIKKRVDEVFASADRGVYPPGSGAKLAKSLIWASGDLQAVRKIYIGIDVKPGFYFFAAIDTTAAKLPDPLQEQVAITVT